MFDLTSDELELLAGAHGMSAEGTVTLSSVSVTPSGPPSGPPSTSPGC